MDGRNINKNKDMMIEKLKLVFSIALYIAYSTLLGFKYYFTYVADANAETFELLMRVSRTMTAIIAICIFGLIVVIGRLRKIDKSDSILIFITLIIFVVIFSL